MAPALSESSQCQVPESPPTASSPPVEVDHPEGYLSVKRDLTSGYLHPGLTYADAVDSFTSAAAAADYSPTQRMSCTPQRVTLSTSCGREIQIPGPVEGKFHPKVSNGITAAVGLVTALHSEASTITASQKTIDRTGTSKVALRDRSLDDVRQREWEMRRRQQAILRRLRRLQTRLVVKNIKDQLERLVQYGVENLQVQSVHRTQDPFLVGLYKELEELPNLGSLSISALLNLVRKIEQASVSVPLRQISYAGHFGVDSVNGVTNSVPSVIVRWKSSRDASRVLDAAARLSKQTQTCEPDEDDLTDSSSGGESCDEFDGYKKKQHLISVNDSHASDYSGTPPQLEKRALWKWATDRASLASKWCWLQLQLADLDLKLKKYKELSSQLNGEKEWAEQDCCARVVPLLRYPRRKRHSLHLGPGSRCLCMDSCPPKDDPIQDHSYSKLRKRSFWENVASCDVSYHHVLSLPEDVTLGAQLQGLLKVDERKRMGLFQELSSSIPQRNDVDHPKEGRKTPTTPSHRRVIQRTKSLSSYAKKALMDSGTKLTNTDMESLKRKRRAAQAVIESMKSTGDTDEAAPKLSATKSVPASREHSPSRSECDSRSSSESKHHHNHLDKKRRQSEHSFDINNIVIPYNAAPIRFERLPYKEIVTPGWIVEEITPLNSASHGGTEMEGEEWEDTRDEAFRERHSRCEVAERLRFLGQPTASLRRPPDSDLTPEAVSPVTGDQWSEASWSPPTTPLLIPEEGNHRVRSASYSSSSSSQSAWKGPQTRHQRLLDFSTTSTSASSSGTLSYLHQSSAVEAQPYDGRRFPLPDRELEKMRASSPVILHSHIHSPSEEES
ncbi:unnamed protein product [Darwinula stevensoni]|uniref:PEHE domain-containing protein n=1 Tax=Darwinula stevensoni TaxID=69355 RepID=A0A7R8XLX0_9CRUS|nr:unnamed protein product [Darwinula stevensoni]CAG0894811.1 unnamed protein product [Darwinula stevensoni]